MPAWKTASVTGVLSYMNYDKAQKYAATYHVQDEVMELQKETLGQYLRLQSYVIAGFDPDKMTEVQAQTAGVDVRQTLAHLEAMDQVGQSLANDYNEALKMK